MEIGDLELKIGILVSLVMSISGIVLLALYKNASDDCDQSVSAEDLGAEENSNSDDSRWASDIQKFETTESPLKPLVEGCIIEYSGFFLKADSGGFVVTDAGDLSIEFFRDKEVQFGEDLNLKERLADDEITYVPTNFGAIHKQHFVEKGVS